jgi:hypothetical protein
VLFHLSLYTTGGYVLISLSLSLSLKAKPSNRCRAIEQFFLKKSG